MRQNALLTRMVYYSIILYSQYICIIIYIYVLERSNKCLLMSVNARGAVRWNGGGN